MGYLLSFVRAGTAASGLLHVAGGNPEQMWCREIEEKSRRHRRRPIAMPRSGAESGHRIRSKEIDGLLAAEFDVHHPPWRGVPVLDWTTGGATPRLAQKSRTTYHSDAVRELGSQPAIANEFAGSGSR
jgi:hypothetical protein